MKVKHARLLILFMVSFFVSATPSLATAEESAFKGSRNDIVGYVFIKVNHITSAQGTATLQARIEKYPVLYADYGSRCEFFLKNPKQDITQGSQHSERVYFKDVTQIKAFKGVSVKDDRYGVSVSVGNKRYQIRKWSGMAALAAHIRGGDCNSISEKDLTYDWPVFHFKVVNERKMVQWIEAGLTSIIEFKYARKEGVRLYDEMLKQVKNKAPENIQKAKSFEQLKEEARKKSELNVEERKKNRKNMQVDTTLNVSAQQYRQTIVEGDDSHCGLVIEVKDKVVKVQTTVGEYWLKRSQLYPVGTKPCNFLNGIYQDQ